MQWLILPKPNDTMVDIVKANDAMVDIAKTERYHG